jgi:hypothetical protein
VFARRAGHGKKKNRCAMSEKQGDGEAGLPFRKLTARTTADTIWA